MNFSAIGLAWRRAFVSQWHPKILLLSLLPTVLAVMLWILVIWLGYGSLSEFIQAQLRGASYYSVARNVQPSGAAGSVDYKGSVWNVVRITEPVYISQAAKPQSSLRLYFINAVNGMIDKVISQENGETITAELFSWDNRDNEVVPSRIVWKRDHQVIMEFLLASVTHTLKQ